MDKKQSFVLYPDQYDCFAALPSNERGDLILALFEHQLGKPSTVCLSPSANMAYLIISKQIDRDSKKYAQICEKRKLARVGKTKQIATKENKCYQMLSSATDNDNENDNENDNVYSSNPPIVPPCGRIERDYIAERFDLFWSEYPKKVGKEAARKAFVKLHPTAELFKVMLDGIEKSKKSQQWQEEHGRFIPNPSTWLNQGRWDDELTEASEVKKPKDEKPRHGDFDTTAALERAIAKSYHMFEETEG